MLNREVPLYVPRKESYPIPLSYTGVTRSTFADLEIAQEKQMYDYVDVDENRNLSDSWTSFTRFTLLNETHPKGFQQSGGVEEEWETDENSQRHHVQIIHGLTHWQELGKQLKEERDKNE